MKKILLLAITFMFFGCSDDDYDYRINSPFLPVSNIKWDMSYSQAHNAMTNNDYELIYSEISNNVAYYYYCQPESYDLWRISINSEVKNWIGLAYYYINTNTQDVTVRENQIKSALGGDQYINGADKVILKRLTVEEEVVVIRDENDENNNVTLYSLLKVTYSRNNFSNY